MVSIRSELQSRWNVLKSQDNSSVASQGERFMQHYVMPMLMKEYTLNPSNRIELHFWDCDLGCVIRDDRHYETYLPVFKASVLKAAAEIAKDKFDIDVVVTPFPNGHVRYDFYVDLE